MARKRIDELFYEVGANGQQLFSFLGVAQGKVGKFAKFVKSPLGLGAITAGLVGLVGIKGTRLAAGLDAALREVATLVPQTAADLGDVRDELIALSTQIPQPPELLTKGLYQAISAGARDMGEALRIVEVSARAAVGGLTDTFTSVDAITTVLNAYSLSANQAERVSDILFTTVERAKTTFPELASNIGVVATTAAQAGIELEELSGLFAAITTRGVSTPETATAINKFLVSFIKQTDDAGAAARRLGIGFDFAAIAEKGFTAVLEEAAEATGGQVDEIVALNPELRAMRAALVVLTKEGLDKYKDSVDAARASSGAARAAFEEMNGSAQNQAILIGNKVNAELTRLGNEILPVVIRFLEIMNDLLGETPSGINRLAVEIDNLSNELQDADGPFGRFVQSARRATRDIIEGITDVPTTPFEFNVPLEIRALPDIAPELEQAVGRAEQLEIIQRRIDRLGRIRGEAVFAGDRDTIQAASALIAKLEELKASVRAVIDLEDEADRARAAAAGQRQAQIEAEVQERADAVRRQQELLAQFGFTLFEDVPEGLSGTVRELIGVEERIVQLKALMEEAGDEGGQFGTLLAALEGLRSKLLAQAIRIQETPEGQIRREGLEALETIEDLERTRAALGEFGLTESDAPDALLSQIEVVQALEDEIESLEEARQDLIDTETEGAEAVLELIAARQAELQQAEELRDRLGGVAAALSDLPSLQLDLLAELEPEQLDALIAQLDDVARARNDLADAEASAQLVREGLQPGTLADEEREVQEATERLNTVLRTLSTTLLRAGVPLRVVLRILAAIRSETEQVNQRLLDLSKTLDGIENLARGVLGVARAFGVLGEAGEESLTGIVDLIGGASTALEGLATGNLAQIVGGATQGLGGLAGLFGGLFGESESDRIRNEVERDTQVALRRLTDSLDTLAQFVLGLSGEDIAGGREASKIIADAIAVIRRNEGGDLTADSFLEEGEFGAFLRDRLRAIFDETGLTFTDLERIAGDAGFSIENLAEVLDGNNDNVDAAVVQFLRLGEAIDQISLVEALSTFNNQLLIMRARIELFGDAFDTPLERLEAFQGLLTTFAPNLASRLSGFDLNTQEGRDAFRLALQGAFEELVAGNDELLGALTFQDVVSAILESNSLLEEIEGNTEGGAGGAGVAGSSVPRSFTEVTGNRMVGVLTTISVIEQLALGVLRAILLNQGGTVPQEVAVVSFRTPGTEAEILTVEQAQLEVLQQILAATLANGGLVAPTPAQLNAAIPPVNGAGGLGGGVQLTLQVAAGAVAISGVADPTEAADAAVDALADRLLPRIENQLAVLTRREREASGTRFTETLELE